VGGPDRARIPDQQRRRPQPTADVVTGGLQLGGQAAVQDDDLILKSLREPDHFAMMTPDDDQEGTWQILQ
jgi:hypothetical protein